MVAASYRVAAAERIAGRRGSDADRAAGVGALPRRRAGSACGPDADESGEVAAGDLTAARVSVRAVNAISPDGAIRAGEVPDMPWWGWIVIGMLLLGTELLFVEAEFFLVFIGVSALVTGLVAVAAPGLPDWSHWLVFAAVAVASMVFFRRRVYRALRPQNVPGLKPDFLGDEINVPVALAAGGTCRVELHGHDLAAAQHGTPSGGRRWASTRPRGRGGRVVGRTGRRGRMSFTFTVVLVIALVAILLVARTAVVVPQQNACVVEYPGKYSRTLQAGFHILVPFVENVSCKHSLKEQAIDIPEQTCITKGNVQVGVDGVIDLRVLDAQRASYGIADYVFAITQLAQTTLRSEIGKIDLDRTFEERSAINANVVAELDKASDAWGVKVLRYEVKNINPPRDVLSAMQKQMRAEREKQRVIKESEATKQQQINEAEGEAAAILAVATAKGLRQVALALREQGGAEAMQLRIAESCLAQFGQLAKAGNTLVVPANLTDLASMVTLAKGILADRAPPPGRGG